MRFSKSTLNYALIIYICAFLAVGPFVGGLSAKITPKSTEEEVGIVVIKKGDTLWDLAIKYFQDPFLWKEFKKYNKFTNPDLIYPGEKVQLPEKILLPTGVARQIESEIIATMGATKADLDKVTAKYDKVRSEFQSVSEDVKSIKDVLANLKEKNQALEEQLIQNKEQLQKFIEQMKREQDAQSNETKAQIGELKNLLKSQESASQSVKEKIDELEQSLEERFSQMYAKKDEIAGLSEKIEDYNNRLTTSQNNIADLQKKIEEAEEHAEEASKIAVATAVAGGLILFVVGVLAR